MRKTVRSLILLICVVLMTNEVYAYTISVGGTSNGKYGDNGNCFLGIDDNGKNKNLGSATVFMDVFLTDITKKFDGTGEIPAIKKFGYSNNAS